MKSIKNYIKESYSDLILISIIFLFFLQLVSDLVESIYTLDLLNTSLDEKVLGILFFLTPLLIITLKKGISKKFLDFIAIIIIVFRVINPFMDTSTKIVTAGIGVGCFMIFLPAYFWRINISEEENKSITLGVGLAFAVLFSITFKSLLSSFDISTYGWFQLIGWGLSIVALVVIFGRFNVKLSQANKLNRSIETDQGDKKSKKIIIPILGIMSILIIIYFAFSSPVVFSRWTEGDYFSTVIITAGMVVLFSVIMIIKPEIINKLKPWIIWLWNGLFFVSLLLTIVVNIIPFPASPSSQPVIVSAPTWPLFIPLYLMLFLLPIIFFDFVFLARELIKRQPSLPKMGRNFTFGGLLFIILILILIFTNVWGYVDVVSLIFRNLFWLPFLILGVAIVGSILNVKKNLMTFSRSVVEIKDKIPKLSILAILFSLIIVGIAINNANPSPADGSVTSITVFTYNLQQGVNDTGQKNLDGQIALIKEIDPDIITLQECDTVRISIGNLDIVRYFADRLTGFNFYSYYGPKTVTGTYGTAILSRYPIIKAQTVFTFSDQDEIGTAEAQIQIGSEIFYVYNNHPDGSDDAKLTHIQTLIDLIGTKDKVIAMGDYNFREYEIYYDLINSTLQDAWKTVWPTGIDDNGISINIADRIDYIFLSNDFTILDARYITDPQSDHPAHWATIQW